MDCTSKMYGSVTVGNKGQVVIPHDVRHALNIGPGDSLVVITKGDMAIGLIKNESMPKVLEYLQNEMKGK